MHHVFISYSRRQSEDVGAVVDAVRSAGTPVWLDLAEIPEGVPWERQLRRAIREADLVVYFVSDDWLTSAACALEREITAEYGKTMVPIRVRDSGIDVHLAASSIQTAHAGTPDLVSEHTDLECAAGEWLESGSSRRRLARGDDLRRFKVAARASAPATEVARRFLDVSTRAARLRRVDALLGFAVVLLAVVALRTLPAALQKSQDARDDLIVSLSEYAAMDAAAQRGPYDALAEALTVPEAGAPSTRRRSSRRRRPTSPSTAGAWATRSPPTSRSRTSRVARPVPSSGSRRGWTGLARGWTCSIPSPTP
jgi:hypothetical protein